MQRSLKLSSDADKNLQDYNIVVQIPKTWDFTRCGHRKNVRMSKQMNQADIQVTQGDGGGGPKVLHHQGCGRKGLLVSIPEDFIDSFWTGSKKDQRGKGNS